MTNEAIIEVSIPMHYFETEPAEPECSICTHAMCKHQKCSLTPTTLTCCGQKICCGCFVKILHRCRCTAECTAVVGTCPFCRDMCRADTASLFMARQSHCRSCRAK